MSYIPTKWVDNETLIDAEKLNKIEQGIKDASVLAEAAASGEMLTNKPDLYLTETKPTEEGLWVWFQPVRLREVVEEPEVTEDMVLDLSEEEAVDGDILAEIDGVDYTVENATTDEAQANEGVYLFDIK